MHYYSCSSPHNFLYYNCLCQMCRGSEAAPGRSLIRWCAVINSFPIELRYGGSIIGLKGRYRQTVSLSPWSGVRSPHTAVDDKASADYRHRYLNNIPALSSSTCYTQKRKEKWKPDNSDWDAIYIRLTTSVWSECLLSCAFVRPLLKIVEGISRVGDERDDLNESSGADHGTVPTQPW